MTATQKWMYWSGCSTPCVPFFPFCSIQDPFSELHRRTDSFMCSRNSCFTLNLIDWAKIHVQKKPQSFPSATWPGGGQVPQTVWSKVTGAMRVTKKLRRQEQTLKLHALLVLRRFEVKPGNRTSSSCISENADTDASSQIQSIWNVLSYCSISLGLQIPTLAIGVDCVLFLFFVLFCFLCYALKCMCMVKSCVGWFICISM